MENNRVTAIEISKAEFTNIGYQLINTIADFLDTIRDKPVTTGETPKQIQDILGNASLPEHGAAAAEAEEGPRDDARGTRHGRRVRAGRSLDGDGQRAGDRERHA